MVEEELPDGRQREMDRKFLRGQAGQKKWSEMWQLLRVPEPSRLLTWWKAHRTAGTGPVAVARLRLFTATAVANPDGWDLAPRRERLLASLAGPNP